MERIGNQEFPKQDEIPFSSFRGKSIYHVEPGTHSISLAYKEKREVEFNNDYRDVFIINCEPVVFEYTFEKGKTYSVDYDKGFIGVTAITINGEEMYRTWQFGFENYCARWRREQGL